ncbi:MAG: sulfotransferase [Candidatus Thiodiazotropha sp. (ex Lucinoma kastoroae)]|nr:sulfotransferase [Candidatus Thiodiazotropha sp. (ex Lucinoma kastoroae)]
MKTIDVFRTRLRDVLFGRTSIKVVTQDRGMDVVPIFLIGTFRSGTTLFRYLLDSHSQICCPPETKFHVHLAAMYNTASAMDAFIDMGFEEGFIRHQLRKFSSTFYSAHLEAMSKKCLVDKTPEYVRILNYLDWLYEGKCRYLLIYRNGLDVTHSMNEVHIEPIEQDKSLDKAFEYWKSDTQTMLDWMEKYPDRCHKVVYDQLCDDTKDTLNEAMKFIGLEMESQQMKWYSHSHSRGAEDIKARRLRSINKSVHNYDEWPEEIIKDLKLRSASIHRAVGYDPNTLEFG